MLDQQGLDRNFQFLVLEVTKQVESSLRLLQEPTYGVYRRLRSRDDYIDHLKSIIENGSFNFLQRHGDVDDHTVNSLRSLTVVVQNMERIGDHALSIVRQTGHFSDAHFMHQFDYQSFYHQIFEGLRLVPQAYEERDAQLATQLSRIEVECDRLYKAHFETVLERMQRGRDIGDLITALFIFHYLERIGDCLLNIGEAILFSRTGERLRYHQYKALRDALAEISESDEPLDQVDFEGIYGTRSGCRIGKVSEREPVLHADDSEAIYKQGELAKIRQERDSIEEWNRLAPGLPPRILQYREEENQAALLVEYLSGSTFQEIALNANPDLLDEALGRVTGTLAGIWQASRKPEPNRPRFLKQLRARLGDVYRVHPGFRHDGKWVGELAIPNIESLLDDAQQIDEDLVAPFTVFAHGDLNLDNIIYNREEQQVHFIDLHRSGDMDYVQDVSTFLTSNFRLPVFEPVRRSRLERSILGFLHFARSFAVEQNDATFQARLAIGLARGLATSTRFEYETDFASNMLRRSIYLLQRLLRHRGAPWEAFEFPLEVLLY